MRKLVAEGCIFVACLLGTLTVVPAAEKVLDTSKMNVLLLDFEDFSAASLGCYGNPICKSPNFDRLAANGVLFERAYVQAVCCNPSRSSFLTGLRPETTNVHTNSDPMPERLPQGTKTLPTYFKQQGFYLANIGKLFHGGFEGDHLRMLRSTRVLTPTGRLGGAGADSHVSAREETGRRRQASQKGRSGLRKVAACSFGPLRRFRRERGSGRGLSLFAHCRGIAQGIRARSVISFYPWVPNGPTRR